MRYTGEIATQIAQYKDFREGYKRVGNKKMYKFFSRRIKSLKEQK